MRIQAEREPPIRVDDPCILFAMGRESAAFRREFRPHLCFDGAPCWARFCGPAWLSVLVVEAGIGQASVGRTLDWLLSKPRVANVPYVPKLLIFAGYAGGLTPELRIGDVVLADEIVDEHGGCWPTTWPETLLEGRWQPPIHRGRVVTVDRAAATPDAKRQLARTHQALAVEMESAVFAARCTAAGVPFGCVRAISDDAHSTLSLALMTLLEDHPVSPWKAFKAVLRRPSLIPEFWRLGRDTRTASRQLALALGELLTLTLPWDV